MTISTGRSTPPPQSKRGFSAVEIIAVATIMAILALVLLPMLLNRVLWAKEKAAQDELVQLEKVMTLAYAENGVYPRLQDLDNTTAFDPADPNPPVDVEVPNAYYRSNGAMVLPLADSQRAAYAMTWNGPYTHFRNTMTVAELRAAYPALVSETDGPIWATAAVDADEADLYPLDPWGTPYLFFPPETDFRSPVLYSFGADLLPGGLDTRTDPGLLVVNPADLDRSAGVLGTGDDLEWKF